MGISSSTFDRRNSVERRTQRRVLQNFKTKLQKLDKELKKFAGLPDDDQFKTLKDHYLSLHRDLHKKTITLQPKNRVAANDILKQIETSLKFLEQKAKDNLQIRVKKPESVETRVSNGEAPETEAGVRQTVELRVLEVTTPPPTSEISRNSIRSEATKSPEDTRKSILKLGVPVMPNVAQELRRRVSQENQVEAARILKEIAATRKEVESIELEISQFIGTKNGRHYNRIKEKLYVHTGRLHNIHSIDEDVSDQKELCIKYIDSCLSFLDEKAEESKGIKKNEDSTDEDDEVYLPSPTFDKNANNVGKKAMVATQI